MDERVWAMLHDQFEDLVAAVNRGEEDPERLMREVIERAGALNLSEEEVQAKLHELLKR
jgi:hypothetical protein